MYGASGGVLCVVSLCCCMVCVVYCVVWYVVCVVLCLWYVVCCVVYAYVINCGSVLFPFFARVKCVEREYNQDVGNVAVLT